jgi:hypothetical protein
MKGASGETEARAVRADKVVESERKQMQRSRYTGNDEVDWFEKYVGDIIRAERQRVKDRDRNKVN